MRRLFVVLALPLLLFGLTAAHKKSDREAEDLLGAVRSVQSERAEVGDSDPPGVDRTERMDRVIFDKDGKEIERTIYSDYGELVGRQVYTHDANGHLTESVLSDPKGTVLERWVHTYAGGRLARTVGYDGKGTVGDTIDRFYDEGGRLLEISYHEGKKALGKTVYTYDPKGRVSEAAFYGGDGSRAVAPVGPGLGAHRLTYSYDDMDRTIKAVAYEPDGRPKKSWQYSYDVKGQMAEDVREDDWSRTTFAYAYEYDSRGNWIKQIATSISQMKPGLSAFEEAGEMEPYKRKIITSREIAYY